MKIRSSAQRGSVLIVTLIFSAIIAIALTTYMKMATTALNLSERSFLANDTMNVTEAGLEQALWSFNQATAGSGTAWTDWTISGNNATRTFTGFTFAQGAQGSVKVFVRDYNSSGTPVPLVVSKAIVTPASGSVITKYVEVYLTRRSLFGNGLVGRNGLTFSGNNATVDSWNSLYDDAGAARGSPTAYSAAVKHDKGTIAALNVAADISVQNADIFGYASVGGTSTDAIDVGAQGLVGPFGTSSGTKDPTHIAANYTDDLPTPTAPTPATVSNNYSATGITGNVTLPAGGDSPAADGVYYYNVGGINFNNKTLLITGSKNVVLLLGANGVGIGGGSGTIQINSGSTLQIYTSGNVDIAGNGLVNSTTQAKSLQIWGTNTTAGAQTIKVAGNGALTGVVYAPNANIEAKGGGTSGSIYGSFVGWTVKMTGNDAFHYDESLGNYGANNPFQVSKWRELVSQADRSVYSSQLSF